MSEEERKNERPDKIVEIVEQILRFNKQNQERYGLKILTPNQMLSRFKIRQLLYSLHKSEKLIKEIYKSLVDVIKNGNNFYEY